MPRSEVLPRPGQKFGSSFLLHAHRCSDSGTTTSGTRASSKPRTGFMMMMMVMTTIYCLDAVGFQPCLRYFDTFDTVVHIVARGNHYVQPLMCANSPIRNHSSNNSRW